MYYVNSSSTITFDSIFRPVLRLFNIPDSFNIPANIDLDIVESPQRYISCFLKFAFVVLFDMKDLYSQIPYQNYTLFSSAYCFLV
jgi:hypothetical protein